jgi:DNA-binding MarR family transcriptional regulator
LRPSTLPYRRERALADLARTMLEHLKGRTRFLPGAVFEDPQWLMTLELFIAAEEAREVPVSVLCGASGVPPTTALRHIRWLESKAIFERVSHPKDRRISYVRLSDAARDQVARYLMSVSSSGLTVGDDPPLRAAH